MVNTVFFLIINTVVLRLGCWAIFVILLIRFDFKTQQTEIVFRLSGMSSTCAFKRESEANQGKTLRKNDRGECFRGVPLKTDISVLQRATAVSHRLSDNPSAAQQSVLMCIWPNDRFSSSVLQCSGFR